MNLSHQKIAAVLIKAGFERARFSRSSRVIGWGRWTKGFDIREEKETKLEHHPVPRSRMRWRNGIRIGSRTELREVKIGVKWIEVSHIVGEYYRVGQDPSPETMLLKYQAALDAAGFRAQWIEPRSGIRGAHLMVTVWSKARFTAEGLSYERARNLIAECNDAGVPANIIPGGIGFYPETRAAEHVMYGICNNYGIKPDMGNTTHEDNVLLKVTR